MIRRATQLIGGCVVLGVGIALLLEAALGSDGYSTMINGLSMTLDQPFWAVNLAVGVVFVAVAWTRGLTPGIGTVTQPVVVGLTVTAATAVIDAPDELWVRSALLVAALPVAAVGVAGYLAADQGAGPTEAAAIALDPPLRFSVGYGLVQAGGALVGWLCGAAVGVGTIVVMVAIGPMVDWVARHVRVLAAPQV